MLGRFDLFTKRIRNETRENTFEETPLAVVVVERRCVLFYYPKLRLSWYTFSVFICPVAFAIFELTVFVEAVGFVSQFAPSRWCLFFTNSTQGVLL